MTLIHNVRLNSAIHERPLAAAAALAVAFTTWPSEARLSHWYSIFLHKIKVSKGFRWYFYNYNLNSLTSVLLGSRIPRVDCCSRKH